MEVWTILLTLMLVYEKSMSNAKSTHQYEKIGAILETMNWKNITLVSDDLQNSILFSKSAFKYGIIVNTIYSVEIISDIDPRSNVVFFGGKKINVLIDILEKHYSEKLLFIANR